MTDAKPDEARLVEYLLGQVDPDERDRIEERYMSDPAFLEEVHAAERDLIDQYVRGELADRTAFETHFLASPTRRERTAFARTLMQSGPVAASPRQPTARQWTWPLAAAAAVVLAAGAWLLLSSPPPVDRQIAETTAPAPAPAGTGTDQSPAPPSPTPPPRTTPAPPQAPRVVTLMLAPTSTRNRGEPSTLVVRDAAQVRLQLSLETAAHQHYRVVIRSVGGADVWSQDRLASQSGRGGPVVTVVVPADRFTSDDYIVTLSGTSSSGGVEEIGGYYFRARVSLVTKGGDRIE